VTAATLQARLHGIPGYAETLPNNRVVAAQCLALM
jgi:hypothetical protein